MNCIKTDLQNLIAYLNSNMRIKALTSQAFANRSLECNERNAADPRGFCFATAKSNVIAYADNIEYLPAENRIGILLHELGHIELQAFKGPASEVDVDVWCCDIPGSGYRYANVEYWSPGHGPRTANSIQCVSSEFVRRIK